MMNKLVSKSLISTGLVIALASVNAYGQDQRDYPEGVSIPTEGEVCDGFAIVPDTGWQICILETAGDTDTFTIPADQEGCLRVTDAFLPGNAFTVVHENGNKGSENFFAGASIPLLGDPAGQFGWESDDHFSARGGLSKQGHTVTVTDTVHPFGASAYYVRFDTDMVCKPLKAKYLVSTPAIIVTNTGKDYEDVVAPDGSVAATNVAPGVRVVIPMPAE